MSRLPGEGDDWYSKTSFSYRNNVWESRGIFQTIGERFNDEMGFVPRTGVNNGELYLGAQSGRSSSAAGCAKRSRTIQFENFTPRNGGGLESRYMDWHWPITFQNSTFIEVGVNPNVEVIDERFTINSRRGINVTLAATSSTSTSSSPTPTPPRRFVQPALRHRRLLRRLPPRLHDRRHVPA